MNKLKNYEFIETEDGSTTLYSKLYGENCHSTSGAIKETELHYIKGCQILEKALTQESISILEVGFGTGIGFMQTLKTCMKNNCFLHFTSFEIDEELIKYFFETNNIPFDFEASTFSSKTDNYCLKILKGNARESIKSLSKKYHAIYQDAFSPKRNAILWTTQWFKDLKNLAEPDCILSTYSSSSSIRKSLLSAGWFLTKGEKFGPKRSSTRANLSGPTDSDIIEHLNRSPAIELTDENYEGYTL